MPATFKLGRQPAKRDSRTLQFADYVGANAPQPSWWSQSLAWAEHLVHPNAPATVAARAKLPNVPPTAGWSGRVPSWPMMGNDVLGDCVIAGIGHQIQSWTADNGRPYVPPDADIRTAYAAVSGWNPTTGANDNGCVMLDALNYWHNVGVSGHKLDAFCSIAQFAHKHIMQGIYLLGGVLAGVNLPKSAQAQFGPGKTWDVTTGPDSQPGTWGGHCILLLDFSPAGLTCVTWGKLQLLTWRWLDTYADELYGLLSLTDWLTGGRSPNGFNTKAILADEKALAA